MKGGRRSSRLAPKMETRSGEARRPEAAKRARSGPSVSDRTNSYFTRHLQTLFYSLGQMWRAPLSALLTAAVLGIALALPAGMHVLLDNAQRLSAGWDGTARISLFLHENLEDGDADRLARSLKSRPDLREVSVITRAQALEEFRHLSGFSDALKALEENPLPAVVVVTPGQQYANPLATGRLLGELRQLREVDMAQLDMQWVKRLYAIMDIARRGVLVVAGLLSLAVLLIIGNTIRLDIQNRREEILVIKLVGATNAFVRRPFLYSGLWFGLFGGVIAWSLVHGSLMLLDGPVQRLSGLYHSSFQLHGMDFHGSLMLMGAAALLGWLGSWISVSRHLNDIEPT